MPTIDRVLWGLKHQNHLPSSQAMYVCPLVSRTHEKLCGIAPREYIVQKPQYLSSEHPDDDDSVLLDATRTHLDQHLCLRALTNLQSLVSSERFEAIMLHMTKTSLSKGGL